VDLRAMPPNSFISLWKVPIEITAYQIKQ
jgi:hypothetical protein